MSFFIHLPFQKFPSLAKYRKEVENSWLERTLILPNNMVATLNIFKTQENLRQFLAFVCVGILNTIFGYGVFSFCIFIGLHYTIATLISTYLGILFNFSTISTLVFKNTQKNLVFQFIGVYGVLYLVSNLLISIMHVFVANIYICGAISTLMMPPFAFYLNKRFVFSPLKKPTLI